MKSTEEYRNRLLNLLRRAGHSEADAQRVASSLVHQQMTVAPGAQYASLWPENMGSLWHRAVSHGRRRLVLEIVAEDQSENVTVNVLEVSDWPQVIQAPGRLRSTPIPQGLDSLPTILGPDA
ncbi:hypothetical protein [Deinococcus aquaedulcis]|uniref:hypothetical protein n=1 Tax=Deinococcus aquaedulcis TaxID=2840455 RepID=UPI001C83D7C8|nr:hypothetical protein [Deinococcus aquaedulcis]